MKNVLFARISENEAAALNKLANAAGMKPGRFAVAAALGLRVTPPVPPVNRRLYADLARVGSNLNQIAHRLHGHNQIDIRDLADTIAALNTRVADVRLAVMGAGK